MTSSLQAVNHRITSLGALSRRIALPWGAAALLVACGGGSPPDAQGSAGALTLPAGLAESASSVVTITTVLPPELRIFNRFGTRAVMRDNGNTLIVAAPGDPLNPLTGQVEEQPFHSWGSVHILTRNAGGPWQQVALLRPTTGPKDEYALELAVSGDGNTIAVGAPEDRSHGSGIGSDPRDHEPFPESGPAVVQFVRGAVWVYVKQGGTWQLHEFIKAAQPADGDLFGYSLDLSHDGNSLAVGAINEGGTGAVHLFHRDAAGRWTLADHLTASNAGPSAFGSVVRLSSDARVLAVGAQAESSGDCRIDGNQRDTSQPQAGAVFVFERNSQGRMEQRTYIKACDRPGENRFGAALAINPAGDLLVVGAPDEDAQVIGCSAPEVPGHPRVGRAYVFTRSGGGWVRSGALGASNAAFDDHFGSDVKMSADASTLAIGASGEDSGLTGVDPPQDDESVREAGAIYIFRRGADGSYAQAHYVKPPRIERDSFLIIGDGRFNGLDLSEDGSVLAVGAFSGESSSSGMGAVYVYDGLF